VKGSCPWAGVFSILTFSVELDDGVFVPNLVFQAVPIFVPVADIFPAATIGAFMLSPTADP